MRNFFLFLSLSLLAACSMMSKQEVASTHACKEDFYVLDKPNERSLDAQRRYDCFGHEFAHIRYRKEDNFAPHTYDTQQTLTGLALSGGGVKSTSFQLGLLAGLHENKSRKNKKLLHYIDYMSSVSGGTWAAATYWAWPEDEDSLFACIDGTINGFSNTSVACRFIGEVLLPRKQGTFLNRESWRKERAQMLLMDDFKLAEWRYPVNKLDPRQNWPELCTSLDTEEDRLACFRAQQRKKRYKRLKHKPYPIFNASHSIDIFTEGKSSRNFPFQITPDYIGTIIDCNSVIGSDENGNDIEGCSPSRRFFPGHFLDDPKKGFFIKLDTAYSEYPDNPRRLVVNDFSGRDRSFNNVANGPAQYDELYEHDYPSTTQTEDFYLSHAMSSSGGLIATLLSTNISIVSNESDVKNNLRYEYKLADGGKSDNLGILPLIERDTKLIIASQIASDKDSTFRDLEVVIKQASKLFKVDLTNGQCIGENSNDDCLDNYLKKLDAYIRNNPIYVHTYTGINGGKRTLILIKPTTANSKAFRQHLESKYPGLYSRLLQYEELTENTKLVFPQNPTLSPTYKQEVMFAYYLLGKYLASDGLGTALKNWIATHYHD